MRPYMKTVLCVLCLLGFICLPLEIHAETAKEEDLPQIVRWEGGHGFDREGTMLSGGWAYDAVNSAGKYVLFGADGFVLRKVDHWDDKDSVKENFTRTEQVTATIALRADVFPGFQGEISVVLAEKSGTEETYTLNGDNMANIPVNSGDYAIQSAEACDGQYVYKVEFPSESYPVQEKALLLLKITVTEEKEGEVRNGQETEEKDGQPADNGKDGSEAETKQNDRQEDDMVMETGIKKYMFLVCCIAAIGLAGYLAFRSRRNKYN